MCLDLPGLQPVVNQNHGSVDLGTNSFVLPCSRTQPEFIVMELFMVNHSISSKRHQRGFFGMDYATWSC